MLVDLGRVLLWVLLSSAVAVVEYSTGLPVVTITVMMVAAQGLATLWFFIYLLVMNMVLAALFMESWLLVWLVILVSGLLFRLPSIKSTHMFFSKISVILLAAVVLSFIRQPVVTPLFLIHSTISLVVSSYILWRKSRLKGRGFDISELRYAPEQ